ncbi:MAG TPA: TIGR03915 family putative DNA repair protein [Prolixibacteraceae bacterium]|nr:TIGR03915 family putative DNA repair protein [Prolixibacteraceae bacterium]
MLLVYDGTFEGYLSVVFEVYSRKLEPINIASEKNLQETMFVEKEFIYSDATHCDRVWKGIQSKLSTEMNQLPYSAWLSCEPGIEMALLQFIRMSFASPVSVEGNFGDHDVLTVRKAARRVMKEAMRMLQFIRFQRTLDDIYFAAISPDYDVMPMTLKHLKERFADQQWVVYDLKRDYGFFYNKETVEEITLNEKSFSTSNGEVPLNLLQEDEAFYQTAWKGYCRNITIRERLNLKLQRQHMPKRYWKFLPEKRV